MSSLFISYARDNEAAAERLVHALECAGHQVWWDRHLPGGVEYSRAIEAALRDSDKVLVLWSDQAVESAWVRDEAVVARDGGKLVPLTIDGSAPPLGFRQFHTIDIAAWLASGQDIIPIQLAECLATEVAPSSAPQQVQRISFCRTADRVTLAYSQMGEGPPLVKVANWLNHLELELQNPLFRHWIAELSRGRRLLRYDERGNGMSDWKVPTLSFDALIDDLATVVDAAGIDRFDLVGISQGSPVAIGFAARYPEKVRRMVLINGFAVGWRHSRDPAVVETWSALATLARTGWGKNNPAFRQTFTGQFFPDATHEQAHWWNELQKLCVSPENAERFINMFGEIDASKLLEKVSVPTLVMHCRDDQLIPFEAGRSMASRIPGAEFVALDSRNHLPLPEEPAWRKLQTELRRFLEAP